MVKTLLDQLQNGFGGHAEDQVHQNEQTDGGAVELLLRKFQTEIALFPDGFRVCGGIDADDGF